MRIWIALGLLLFGADARAADEVMLFNGRDLSGWTFFLEEKDYNAGGKGKLSDFVTVKPGGILEINPTLRGALITEEDYLNFRLHLEWRWVDPKANNNTGLIFRVRPPLVWRPEEVPAFYHVQIRPKDTGDLWVLGGYSEKKLKGDPARSFKPFGNLDIDADGRNLRRHLKSKDVERPLGEWNSLDISVSDKDVVLVINGEQVNEGTELVHLPGRIGLQSEFGPVQFRNVRLTPIEE